MTSVYDARFSNKQIQEAILLGLLAILIIALGVVLYQRLKLIDHENFDSQKSIPTQELK